MCVTLSIVTIIVSMGMIILDWLPIFVDNNLLSWFTMTIFVEGSLETKVPTIWTDEKQHSQEEAEPGRNSDV